MRHNILGNLEAIELQSKSVTTAQLFFQLLHEFVLELMRNFELHRALQKIEAKEQEFNRWLAQAPDDVSPEDKKMYALQRKIITDWYAIKQLKAFLERYDWAHHDNAVKILAEQGIDTAQFTSEHGEFMKYAITGKCPSIFPTVDEYRHYMRRIIESLKIELSISANTESIIPTYPFKFDRRTTSLLISDHKPIKFTRNKNPSVLLGYLSQNNWKNTLWKNITSDLDLDNDQIERTLRQIKDRLPHSLPEFLSAPNHPDKLEEKIVAVSPAYKIHS